MICSERFFSEHKSKQKTEKKNHRPVIIQLLNSTTVIGLYSMVKVPYLVKGNQLVMERLMGKLYNLVYLLLLALPVKSAAIDTPPSSGTITDSRDGRQYHWIRIGEHKWLTENMAFELKESYPKCELCDVNDGTANNEGITKHDYIENYGRLYPWESALSVCPDGWRLPTIEEWQHAIEAHGPLYLSGRKMSKNAAELSSWGNWNGYASNDLGFSVLPAGRIEVSWDNFINYMKGFAFFWSATTSSKEHAYSVSMNHFQDGVEIRPRGKYIYAMSVRCINE